jgi:HEAT repeat protein
MDVSQPSFSTPQAQPEAAPTADPRLRPTPDYETLGGGSDFQNTGFGDHPETSRPPKLALGKIFLTIGVGVFFGVVGANIGSAHAAWSHFADLFAAPGNAASPAPPDLEDSRQLDRLKPQKQAETLLELAVGRSDGAIDQISSRVDRWQGKLKWNPQIATLTTAALNSSDMRVRESGIEVELAAYGLSKNSASLDYLMQTAESSDHAQKIWALWALGLMGNQGVDTGQVVQTLNAHLKDKNEDQESRQWAVQALALVGTPETIPLLLTAMHDDPSPVIRESAACGLAASGMFTPERRLAAVPQLLNYTDDPALDAQTHAWAFQALADITHQRLPNDAEAWRHWYESQN